MNSPIRLNPSLSLVQDQVLNMAVPANISYLWNFGSLLGCCLRVQILRGVILAAHYRNRVASAFDSVDHIMRDVNYGWLLRIIHANGARCFFFCLYLHVARGVYMSSYEATKTWLSGVGILLLVQATAFIGYVLPWGQISFWGATVITKLLSSIPQVGPEIVLWIWGGFSVGNPTLSRFFSFHYVLPFVVAGLVVLHLIFLHEKGSRNPLGLPLRADKINFQPYFSVKDLFGVAALGGGLVLWALACPWTLGDPENFLAANIAVTPKHIQPEWYFLFAYAILRAIPRKFGGVVALVAAILIYGIMPFFPRADLKTLSNYPISKVGFWAFISIVLLLTWAGARPAQRPYTEVTQLLRFMYFRFFFLLPVSQLQWDRLLKKPKLKISIYITLNCKFRKASL